MDGQLVHQMAVETKPSGLVYFSPYSEVHFRVTASRRRTYAFRAGFLNDDDFHQDHSSRERLLPQRQEQVPGFHRVLTGPYGSKPQGTRQPETDFHLQHAKADAACAQRIVPTLGRRVYRRPATRDRKSHLFWDSSPHSPSRTAKTSSTEFNSALEAMLVSPNFLFRVERDPDPKDPAKIHRVSDLELATPSPSCFLRSSTPDRRTPAMRRIRQAPRPCHTRCADQAHALRSAILRARRELLGGQWLELRNLDSIKPDPDRYLLWGPELKNAMKTETLHVY